MEITSNTKTLLFLALLFVLLLTGNMAFANRFVAEPEVQTFINQVAEHYDFSPAYVKNIIEQAHYNPEVIQKMGTPYEAKPWYEYQQLFVTPERVDNGVDYWSTASKIVAWEENQYSVPGNVVLAIIGVESKYGTKMGDFRVLDTLTTLAFDYPPQAKLFQSELGSFIAMVNSYHLNPATILGSYAGAMGQCQFMPSSYLYFAVDFQDHNRPDLFNNKPDVIFSVGNFLRQHGWETDQPIAVPAKITGSQFQKVVLSATSKPTDPTLSLTQLADYGVYPAAGNYDQKLKANLLSFEGSNGPEYWLTFHNFYVLTRYNVSNLYALAVFELSVKLQLAWDQKNANNQQNVSTNSPQ